MKILFAWVFLTLSCNAMKQDSLNRLPDDLKKLIPYAIVSVAACEKDNYKETIKTLKCLSQTNRFFRSFIKNIILGNDDYAKQFTEYFINTHHQKNPENHPIFIAAKLGTQQACIILKDLLEKTFPEKLDDLKESILFRKIFKQRLYIDKDGVLLNRFQTMDFSQFSTSSLVAIDTVIPDLPGLKQIIFMHIGCCN